jgi:hypothetical protein
VRKPDTSFLFILITVTKKNIIGDAILCNNASFSAPPRALREDNFYMEYELEG